MLRTRVRLALAGALLAVPAFAGCPGGKRPEVVVYTSVDQVYAQQVFDRFREQTGVRVRPVFDTEASKTTGLYNRLLAERRRPRADVFWNNEICRTVQLAEAGLAADLRDLVPPDIPRRWVDPTGRWVAFSLRARVIVYNTTLLKEADVPRTLQALTTEPWRGKVAMANPLFGTTASHAAALYEDLGDTHAEALFRALKANGVRLVDGNSVVRDVVARGEVPLGLTDTDDVFAGIQDGRPIGLVVPDQGGMGTFVIPNTAMLVAGGPNPDTARRFVRFLLEPQVEEMLAFGRPRQVPVRDDVNRPDDLKPFADLRAMDVDFSSVAARMPATARRLTDIFGL